MRTTALILLLGIFLITDAGAQISAQSKIDSLRLMQHLKTLSSAEMAGRMTGTEGNKKAAEYIQQQMKAAGLQPWNNNWKHSFSIDAKGYPEEGVNILGFLSGKSDSIVLVSAHYDHLGVKDKKIYYGADDNASGVAVLLEAARVFANKQQPPSYTLLFAAFDAEEGGLLGAYALAKALKEAGKPVKFNLNMDMVSKGYDGELYAAGSYHYPHLKRLLDTLGTYYSEVKLKLGHDLPGTGHDDWTFSSDHGPFHTQGIPFVYFGVEDHPHYHQPSDTFDKTPFSFFYRAANTIVGFLDTYLSHAR